MGSRAFDFVLPAPAAICSESRVIGLPLTEKTGFGPFSLSYGGYGINTVERSKGRYNLNPQPAPDGVIPERTSGAGILKRKCCR